MRTMALLLAGAVALAPLAYLPAQAFADDPSFTRKGTSLATQRRDSTRCWRLAQKVKLTEEQATQNLLAAYLVGGIVGVIVVSSMNEDANKDPRSPHRQQAHDECMAKLGYAKAE